VIPKWCSARALWIFGFAFLLFPACDGASAGNVPPRGYSPKDETGRDPETVGPTNGWLIIQGGSVVTGRNAEGRKNLIAKGRVDVAA
jgi:hypothetical protein